MKRDRKVKEEYVHSQVVDNGVKLRTLECSNAPVRPLYLLILTVLFCVVLEQVYPTWFN